MNADSILASLTDKILAYESGDMVRANEIFGELSALEALAGPGGPELALAAALRALAESEFRGRGREDFTLVLSQGLDAFQDLLACEDPERRKRLSAKAEDFLRGLSKEGPALSAGPASAQAGGRQEPDAPGPSGDILAVFLSDCSERMARAEEITLDLERNLGNAEIINELFRIFHTIKGECGFLKIDNLGELSHNVENVLDLVRSGRLSADAAIIDGVLEGIDVSRKILKALGQGGIDMPSRVLIDGYIARVAKFALVKPPSLGEILVQSGKVDERDLETLLQEQKASGFGKKLGELAVEAKMITPGELSESLEAQKKLQAAGTRTERVEQIVKVKAAKVSYLVDMIGELLIAIGMVQDRSSAFNQVRKISRTLQRAAMDLRTESVKALFGNARRVVRDLCAKLGKDVELLTYGDELEIDRNLIEKLEEPIMHIVRNSLDHGIEAEEERARAGKPAKGRLTIGAERRGNNIVISVADDGRGLDRERILAKAAQKGLVQAKDAASMGDAAAFNLIFVQGFSTKESVDYVSGRGVGMDIVKTAVTAAKGRVELQTAKGSYTKVLLIFPLSTAIVEGMLVRLGSVTLVIPIASILESISVKPGAVSRLAPGVEVITVRQEPIPFVRLAAAIGFEGMRNTEGAEDRGESARREGAAVIVENAEKRKFALAVDEILAKREVVIKPLGAMFRDIRGVSSGTVLSGGRIGLVLDVDQTVELAEGSRGASAGAAEEEV